MDFYLFYKLENNAKDLNLNENIKIKLKKIKQSY